MKVEIVNYYYQWQTLKPSGKIKAKNFTVVVKTANGTDEKATMKGATGLARLRGSARSKGTAVPSCQ
jgi:hypothetical protein